MSDAFLIGAGFSHAVGEAMPLVTTLRDDLYAQLEVGDLPKDWRIPNEDSVPKMIPFSNFELLLSYLSNGHPSLDEIATQECKILFDRVTTAAADVLWSKQHWTMGSNPPTWAVDLVSHWISSGATVATLNYDTIVEGLAGKDIYRDLYSFYLPGTGGIMFVPEGTPTPDEGMKYCKLHGSLNWFVASRGTSETWPADGGNIGRWGYVDHGSDFQALLKTLPGNKPLIVPPTFGKSSYFTNVMIRETWKVAQDRFNRADHLWMLGYSMPSADVEVRALVESSMDGKTIAPVTLAPKMEGHLRHLFPRSKIDSTWILEGDSGVIGKWAQSILNPSK